MYKVGQKISHGAIKLHSSASTGSNYATARMCVCVGVKFGMLKKPEKVSQRE